MNLSAIDSGAHTYCDGCGSDGSGIIGWTQGIGGLRNDPATEICESVMGILEDAPSEITSPIPAHHSISQQRPKITTDTALNENVQGLLLQRFLLVAHEIGHSLGAMHFIADGETIYDPDGNNTIMSPVLTNQIDFILDEESIEQIDQCLTEC